MLADLLARAGLLLDNRVTQLLREIADHPNDVNLYEAAARAFNIRAMHELAAAAAREGLGVDGDSDRLWHELILAESLHKKALAEIARQLAQRDQAQTAEPLPWVSRELSLALYLLEKDREAAAMLSRSRQLGDTAAAGDEVEGYLRMGRGDYKGALLVFRRAFEKDSRNLRALRLAAESYQRLDRPEESRKADLAVVQRDEYFVRAWHNLGELWLKVEKNPARATQCFARALAINPRDWTVYFTLADEHLGHGQFEMAKGECARLLALSPPDEIRAETLNYLGYIELRRSRLAAARARFRQALQVAPKLAEAWGNLGVISLRHGDAKRADQLLERATELDGQLAWALAARARTRLLLKDIPGAKALLAAAVEADADDGQARIAALELAAAEAGPAAALKAVTAALAEYPGNAEMLLLKARLEAGSKKTAAAMNTLGELLALDAIDPRAAERLQALAAALPAANVQRKVAIRLLRERLKQQVAAGINPENTIHRLVSLGENEKELHEIADSDDL